MILLCTRLEIRSLFLALQNVQFFRFNKRMLVNVVFIIFFLQASRVNMAGKISPALRVQLFLEAAETKLVSITRYWLIFGRLNFFCELT